MRYGNELNFFTVIAASLRDLRWALEQRTAAASVDQTAPATHATANEQRWTKKHLWLLNYSTNKKELEAGMCCWV